MSITDEIMELAGGWAQETKDFGHLDESRPRDDLRKAIEALVTDAARYRAIRDGTPADPDNSRIAISLMGGFRVFMLYGDHADAAIDAAMKGETA